MVEIKGYPGYYATEDGHILSDRNGHMRKLPERMHKGYLRVNVRDGGTPVKIHVEPVHKLVLEAFVGKRPQGCVCRHLNGVATDNRIENLCWGTPKENAQDSIRHGTAVCLRCGEASNAAKLKEKDIIRIKQMYVDGHSRKEIANAYSISYRHASDIILGRTWKHMAGLGG